MGHHDLCRAGPAGRIDRIVPLIGAAAARQAAPEGGAAPDVIPAVLVMQGRAFRTGHHVPFEGTPADQAVSVLSEQAQMAGPTTHADGPRKLALVATDETVTRGRAGSGGGCSR